MKIVVDIDRSYAPCSYLICKVDDNGNWNTRDDNNTILISTDWDYPGVASTLGWQPCHAETDGTVDCAVCGKTASEMITLASDYIDQHLGIVVNDPGYFDND